MLDKILTECHDGSSVSNIKFEVFKIAWNECCTQTTLHYVDNIQCIIDNTLNTLNSILPPPMIPLSSPHQPQTISLSVPPPITPLSEPPPIVPL